MNKILVSLFIIMMVTSVSAFSYVDFVVDRNYVNNYGTIRVVHDSDTNLTCVLRTEGDMKNYSTKEFIIDQNNYGVYYADVGYGHVDFNINCSNGMVSHQDTKKLVVPYKEDTIIGLIAFIILLAAPLFLKPINILSKITKNNPAMDFVITIILLIFVVFKGGHNTLYYEDIIYVVGVTVLGFVCLQNLLFYILEAVKNINKGKLFK